MEDLRQYIQQLREDFIRGELNEQHVSRDPAAQFATWLHQAVEAKIPELQAMSLATVNGQGKPSNRIVYLREFHENTFYFYTNYDSKKGRDLEANPNVAATFFWPELERQVRIEGTVSKAGADVSDAYFNARPYESKLGAWASEQSSTIESRQALEKLMNELQAKYSPETVARPQHWGGYIITANYYEFWQGRKSRLHDRIAYNKQDSNWIISRLAP